MRKAVGCRWGSDTLLFMKCLLITIQKGTKKAKTKGAMRQPCKGHIHCFVRGVLVRLIWLGEGRADWGCVVLGSTLVIEFFSTNTSTCCFFQAPSFSAFLLLSSTGRRKFWFVSPPSPSNFWLCQVWRVDPNMRPSTK